MQRRPVEQLTTRLPLCVMQDVESVLPSRALLPLACSVLGKFSSAYFATKDSVDLGQLRRGCS